MATRLDLQYRLESIVGSYNVYFNAPQNKRMTYPCIKFSLNDIDVDTADDINYIVNKEYQIILVDQNPDSPLVDALMEIPGMRFNRAYIADGLYHFVFSLYY